MTKDTMKIEISTGKITTILLIVLLGLVVVNQYLLFSITPSITGEAVTTTPTTSSQTGGSTIDTVAQIYEEVVPKEGESTAYGLAFSTAGLNTLVGYVDSIQLTDAENERYIRIGTSPNTACEYCCGIGNRGALTSDGNIACGCAHNIGFAGLIKYLIKEGYTDDQIFAELLKWKAYFFPQGFVSDVLAERGISPESVGLPAQRGGC